MGGRARERERRGERAREGARKVQEKARLFFRFRVFRKKRSFHLSLSLSLPLQINPNAHRWRRRTARRRRGASPRGRSERRRSGPLLEVVEFLFFSEKRDSDGCGWRRKSFEEGKKSEFKVEGKPRALYFFFPSRGALDGVLVFFILHFSSSFYKLSIISLSTFFFWLKK